MRNRTDEQRTKCAPREILPDKILSLIQQWFDVVCGRQGIVRAIRRCRDDGRADGLVVEVSRGFVAAAAADRRRCAADCWWLGLFAFRHRGRFGHVVVNRPRRRLNVRLGTWAHSIAAVAVASRSAVMFSFGIVWCRTSMWQSAIRVFILCVYFPFNIAEIYEVNAFITHAHMAA